MHGFTMLHIYCIGGTVRPRATQSFIQCYTCVIQATYGLHMCYPYGYPMVIQLHIVIQGYPATHMHGIQGLPLSRLYRIYTHGYLGVVIHVYNRPSRGYTWLQTIFKIITSYVGWLHQDTVFWCNPV